MIALMLVLEEMSDAERRAWDAFPTGRVVDFQVGDVAADDPVGGGSWGPGRQVRAEVVAALLCGAIAVEPGCVGRLCLRGARITGHVDLRDAELRCAFWLDQCHVGDGIDLTNATTRIVRLTGCYLGPVELAGTSVGGDLSLSRSQLTARDGPALNAAWLTVSRNMICDEVRADGEVRLRGASIGGDLTFICAELAGRDGPALNAEGLSVAGDLLCDGRVHIYGDKNEYGEIIYFRAKGLVILELARLRNLGIRMAVIAAITRSLSRN
jgi:hypothetical protein